MPPKIKAIVDAVRESLDARMAVELQGIEERHSAQIRDAEARFSEAQEQFHGQLAAESKTPALEQSVAKLQADVSAVDTRLAVELQGIEERQSAQIRDAEARFSEAQEQFRQQLAAESKTPALEQSVAKLQADVSAVDTRLTAELQGIEERHNAQIRDAEARFSEAQEQFRQQLAAESKTPVLEQGVAKLQADLSAVDTRLAAELQGIEERHSAKIRDAEARFSEAQEQFRQQLAAESKSPALEQSVAKLQADVSAVDTRLAAELQGIEERHSAQIRDAEARFSEAQEQYRQQLAAESKSPALEQSVAKLQADLAAMDLRMEADGRQVANHLAGLEQHAAQSPRVWPRNWKQLRGSTSTQIEQLEARLRAERAAENLPAQIDSAVAGLRQSLEARLAAEIHDLEARTPDRSPELEKALQYASLLEARVQALEQKLQQQRGGDRRPGRGTRLAGAREPLATAPAQTPRWSSRPRRSAACGKNRPAPSRACST